MRWQRVAQVAVAAVVIVFIAAVVVSLRREKPAQAPRTVAPSGHKDAQLFNPKGATLRTVRWHAQGL